MSALPGFGSLPHADLQADVDPEVLRADFDPDVVQADSDPQEAVLDPQAVVSRIRAT